jgi:hypothetical protein
MKMSEESDEVIPSFVKALSAMDDVTKTKTVKAGPMTYTYADLAQVLDTVRPSLRDNGLAVSQYPSDDGVTTMVFHESGQWLRFPPLDIKPPGANPQQVGSAISYARRYSLLSILGLATEDDDGSLASAPRSTPAPAAARPDPKKAKIDALTAILGSLNDDQKASVKAFAEDEGKSLSAKSFSEDTDWLDQCEAFVGEVLSVGDEPDE